jgi:hypothetical protein
MPERHLFLLEKINSSYKQLAAIASNLNEAFEELGKSVEEIDYALKTSNLGMNLGAPVWILIAGEDDGRTSYWSRELGYDRINNRWGITLRAMSGSYLNGNDKCEMWFFSDAPRHLQAEAAEKLPELFEKLIQKTDSVAARIKGKFSSFPVPATRPTEKAHTICTVCLAS